MRAGRKFGWGPIMLHVFVLMLVYLTPVDGAHPAGTNGQLAFYQTAEECIAAGQRGVATMHAQADPLGEKILGGIAMCQRITIPLISEVPELPTPERPDDDPIENQNRI